MMATASSIMSRVGNRAWNTFHLGLSLSTKEESNVSWQVVGQLQGEHGVPRHV